MEMVVVVVAEQEQQLEQQTAVVLAQQGQYLSTGKLPDPNDLPYKMYAVIKDKIVQGYTWDNSPQDNLEFVLMTYENSPAYVGGTYENGKFKER